MMTPNQIKLQSFSPAGRGAYKAIEVDSFISRVYTEYSELFAENDKLKRKFSSLKTIIDEYNAGKNAIATAIVNSQAVADKTIEEAKIRAASILAEAEEKAKAIIIEKTKNVDAYAEEKRAAADSYYENSKNELQRIMDQVKRESERYVEEINDKAAEIIDNANSKAASIVSEAYADAKRAKDKRDDIIQKSKTDIELVAKEISVFKRESLEFLKYLLPQLEGLSVPNFDFEVSESENNEELQVEALEAVEAKKFELHETYDEPVEVEVVEEVAEDNESLSEPVQAYIPDANEYVSKIFDDIDLPDIEYTEEAGNKFGVEDVSIQEIPTDKTGSFSIENLELFSDEDNF